LLTTCQGFGKPGIDVVYLKDISKHSTNEFVSSGCRDNI
jgi:hypothetical protein